MTDRYRGADPSGPRTSAGTPSPAMRAFLLRLLRPVTRVLFRPSIQGLEHLPKDAPYLLVANHSAGIGLAEIGCLAGLFAERPEHKLAAFVHPLNYTNPITRRLMDDLGAIPSTYEAAEEALGRGVGILLFPGGDYETLRPWWQANLVDFGGRRGFLRIARKAQVPIVPMGIRGSHWTAPMLWRARWMATFFLLPRVFGLRRWGVSLLGALGAVALLFLPLPWPLRLALAWLWMGSPLSFVPIVPVTIRIRIGEPLWPESLFDAEGPELASAYDEVVAAVQALVRS